MRRTQLALTVGLAMGIAATGMASGSETDRAAPRGAGAPRHRTGPAGRDAKAGAGTLGAALRLDADDAAIPACAGHVALRKSSVTGRIAGHGTAHGERYVFTARISGRIRPAQG